MAIGEIILFTVLLFIVLIFILIELVEYKENKEINTETLLYTLFWIVLTTTLFLSQVQDDTTYSINKTYIESLNKDNDSFIIGYSGEYSFQNPRNIYYAYEKIENNSRVLRMFESSKQSPIKIIKTDKYKPHIKIVDYKKKCYKDWIFYDCQKYFLNDNKTIYIPEDSLIKKDFHRK